MESSTEDILQKLKDAGHKFTGKREAIVDLFVESEDKYMTARDVYDNVRASYPRISFDTVYRTLALLEQQNIIEHLEFNEDASKYRLMCQALNHHHHHLICIRCGSTSVMEECPLSLLQVKIKDFKVIDHRFEIYGYCSSCAEVS